jgi:hypothetical protein
MADTCVSLIPGVREVLADKGYDNAFRAFLKKNQIRPVLPGKFNRKRRTPHDKQGCNGRNASSPR